MLDPSTYLLVFVPFAMMLGLLWANGPIPNPMDELGHAREATEEPSRAI